MQLFVLAVITFGALILFATEKLRADLVAVMVAAALALTGLVTVEQAFAGFGSPAVVTVAGIFVMSAGLMHTGGSDHLTRLLRRLGGRGERRLIAATVLLVGLLSSIMNNIGAAIIMMPAVLAAGRDAKVPAGRLLIPLAFGSLLGGLTTAVGTPPNLLVNAALTARGYAPFGLFDFTPTGLAVLG
ncbi:MAG: SLC13 family permease, partial [Limnochordales bacterium]